MFGRKKRNDDVETDEVIDEDFETTEEAPDELDAKEAPEEDESSEEEDTSAYRINLDREDGPFDIDEVDLDADDVERLDGTGVVGRAAEAPQLVEEAADQVGQAQQHGGEQAGHQQEHDCNRQRELPQQHQQHALVDHRRRDQEGEANAEANPRPQHAGQHRHGRA